MCPESADSAASDQSDDARYNPSGADERCRNPEQRDRAWLSDEPAVVALHPVDPIPKGLAAGDNSETDDNQHRTAGHECEAHQHGVIMAHPPDRPVPPAR